MGSKKLKAIAVARGKATPQVVDKEKLTSLVKALVHKIRERVEKGAPGDTIRSGTPASFSHMNTIAALPVKNYLAHDFPTHAQFANIRIDHEAKRSPCWACPTNHSATIKITHGPYAGYEGEEPEYEGLAAFGPQILQPDVGAAVVLSDLADRLGIDVNEPGWVIGWVMECYEKGLLTKDDLNGLEMTWGNVKGTEALLRNIAYREGFGDLLAEGVKRAAEKIGGESLDCAIYTKKGAAPRSHDHRAWQNEMLDTCFSNTGTVEVGGGFPQPLDIGLPPRMDWHNPWEVVMLNAMVNGRRQFEDCTGTCRFCYDELRTHTDILNAITGWNFTPDEALEVGRRIINQLRVFNFRHGFTKDLEAPSARYGSTPSDGPYKGKSVVPYWDFLRRTHYQLMGWDPKTGKPLPETLERIGLSHLIADLK
jgi:aldehyde:ferredoxin oxidoreductase